MPSRRSQRGRGLRAALEQTRESYDEFKQQEEDRARFDSEFEYWQSVGYEEWDNLDTETRADLLRSSAGDLASGVGGLVANRNPISAGGRELLKRMAPDLAKRIFSRAPSKGRVKLMNKIKKIRDNRANEKANREAGIRQAEKELREIQKQNATRTGPTAGQPAASSPYPRPPGHDMPGGMRDGRADTSLEEMVKMGYLLTRPAVMNARAAWIQVNDEDKRQVWSDTLHGKYNEMDAMKEYMEYK